MRVRIDFSYKTKEIVFNSGYIFKGKHYRCEYVRFPTLYAKPEPGTETVELYNFQPKSEIRASVMILPGLGSLNIRFLLWMGTHLASSGINASVLILPGIYTRVANGSASGSRYLSLDISFMYQSWEHAVVDTLSSIDFLEQKGLWKTNNCILGYCLGGMLSTIVSLLDARIYHTVLMTAGGHLPKILFESRSTRFVRKYLEASLRSEHHIPDKERMYKIYDEQLPSIGEMSLDDLMNSERIHPLFKIDPLSYAHLLDKSRTAFIDALFDFALPFQSRRLLYNEMAGAERYIIPVGHVTWLPFEYLLARYILHKVHVHDRKAARKLIVREVIENPLE